MVALDASTLILLAKCDLLPLLAERTPLIVPAAVKREALARPELYDAKVIASMIEDGRVRVARPERPEARGRLEADFGLGAGEAEALLLAKERNVALGTDDGPAIRAAKIMGVPFFTAIHVLVELHARGRLDRERALSKLDVLARLGRYNSRILDDARAKINAGR